MAGLKTTVQAGDHTVIEVAAGKTKVVIGTAFPTREGWKLIANWTHPVTGATMSDHVVLVRCGWHEWEDFEAQATAEAEAYCQKLAAQVHFVRALRTA